MRGGGREERLDRRMRRVDDIGTNNSTKGMGRADRGLVVESLSFIITSNMGVCGIGVPYNPRETCDASVATATVVCYCSCYC